MHASIDTVLRKIGGVRFEDFSQQLKDDQDFYTVCPQSFEELSTSRSLCKQNPLIPDWVIQLFKSGCFLPVMMNVLACKANKVLRYSVVIEDMTQSSAWDVARSVLPYIAGALVSHEVGQPSVVQIVRDYSLKEEMIDMLEKHRSILGSDDLSTINMAPCENRGENPFACFSLQICIQNAHKDSKRFTIAGDCFQVLAEKH